MLLMLSAYLPIYFWNTPKLRFSEQKPAPLIVFYTIHCLGSVKFSDRSLGVLTNILRYNITFNITTVSNGDIKFYKMNMLRPALI